MRRMWLLLAVGFGILTGVGLMATIPVGVTTQEVHDEVNALQASHDGMSQEEAIDAAATYLRTAQRRRVRFLFLAYMAIWTLLGGYIVTLSRRQARLREQLARLEAKDPRE